ncbi:MAG: polysaccharide deacetylase family protein [Bacteroidota bacterium]
MDSLILYSTKISSRLKYAANLILKDNLGLNFSITDKKEEFMASNLFKIEYSEGQNYQDSFYIKSHRLLFESGIKHQNLAIGNYSGLVTLFSNNSSSGFSFDVFSAVFFLVSRYEEYLPHIKDGYNRFEAESSVAFAHGFLNIPIVNHWIKFFSIELKNKYPNLILRLPQYKFISTIDIDNAYSFKFKGLMRSLGGYFRAILNLNKNNIFDRTKAILGRIQDPFDTYNYQLDIQKKYKIEVIYFFLLGDYGVNDKNIPSNNRHLQLLIKNLSDYAEIGIHPSFASTGIASVVKKEISRLGRITHKEVKCSRQHFSVLNFPVTYQILIENDVKNDFSMGYHDLPGFRAGTSSSFFWYDLENEVETSLRVHPLVFSESCLKYNMKMNPEQAFQCAKSLIDKIKESNGTFVSSFHNESMGNYGEWKGWENLYEQVVIEAIRK